MKPATVQKKLFSTALVQLYLQQSTPMIRPTNLRLQMDRPIPTMRMET